MAEPYTVSDPRRMCERQTTSRVANVGTFSYDVPAIQHSFPQSVVLKVTQLAELDQSIIDPKIQGILLKADEQSHQSAKLYEISGRGSPLGVAFDGMNPRISEIDLFPLDMPDVLTADYERA